MIADRYHYEQLNPEERKLYSTFYKGLVAYEKEITVPFSKPSSDVVNRVFHAISHDNPNLFYFNQTCLNYSFDWNRICFIPQYFCAEEQIREYNSRIQICVNDILQQLDLASCSEYEKVKRVHDYFAQNITYDYEALHTSKVNRLVAAHSIIGVFAKQRAVCEGIAKAVKLILNAANVACIVVSGNAFHNEQGGHSWNVVKIDGKAYHLDVTWDLTSSKNGFICYDYFNLTEVEIKRDHFDFESPICKSNEANYFHKSKSYFQTIQEAERYLLSEIRRGSTCVYFRIAEEGHPMQLIMNTLQQFALSEIVSKRQKTVISGSFNQQQRTGVLFFS